MNRIKSLYCKYLVPLLSIMSMALILGGILIAILVYNNITQIEASIIEKARKEFKKDVEFKHNIYTRSVKNEITNKVVELNSNLYKLSNSLNFRRGEKRKIRIEVDSLMANDTNILETKIIDLDGRADYAHCNPVKLYSNDLGVFRPSDEFNKDKEYFMSKTYLDLDTKERYNYIGLPIYDNFGKVSSCLMVRYSLDFILEPLENDDTQKMGNMYVLDQNNILIAQTNGSLTLNKFETISVKDKMRLYNQRNGTAWEDKIFSFFKNKLGWTFVLETESNQALVQIENKIDTLKADFDKSTYGLLLMLVAVILGLVVIAGLAGIRVARSVTKPITDLIGGVQRVADGDLNVQLSSNSKDEVGILTNAFNDMTQSLKHYREEIESNTETITQQAEKLSASNEELEQYAHTVSHDLKSPLRTIGSYIGIINKKYKDQLDDDCQEYLQYITDGTKRMNRIIEDILAYAQIDKNNNEQDFKIIDLNEIVNSVKNDLQYTVLDNNAQIISEKLPQIYGHPTHIHILFQNLICNGIKYRKPDVDPIIKINFHIKQYNYIISIEDNGSGIEEEYLKEIFKPFKRLVSNSKVEGNGIGLATVKKILRQHNGTIWAESDSQSGTTFFVQLPMDLKEQEKKEEKTIEETV